MIIESSILFGLSGLGLAEGIRLMMKRQYWGDPIGPGGYLFFFSAVLLICTVIYLVTQLKYQGRAKVKSISLRFGPVVQVLAVLGLYWVSVPIIGYACSSALFFVLTLYIYGMKSWLKSVPIGLAFALAFELIFVRLAKIPFP